MIILCDIDGTAADISHRTHLVEGKNEGKEVDWPRFIDEMVNDVPNRWCQVLLNALVDASHKVIFITGRPDSHRHQTEEWLEKYYPKAFTSTLYMRPTGSLEPDYLIKEHILNSYFDDQDQENILFVLDDRRRVVEMWRRNGLTVLQCDEGNF